MQHKAILERQLPDKLKMAIAKQIENNLFSKASACLLRQKILLSLQDGKDIHTYLIRRQRMRIRD